jgi:hypothetical protein
VYAEEVERGGDLLSGCQRKSDKRPGKVRTAEEPERFGRGGGDAQAAVAAEQLPQRPHALGQSRGLLGVAIRYSTGDR